MIVSVFILMGKFWMEVYFCRHRRCPKILLIRLGKIKISKFISKFKLLHIDIFDFCCDFVCDWEDLNWKFLFEFKMPTTLEYFRVLIRQLLIARENQNVVAFFVL